MVRMTERSVCFTGHRKLTVTDELREELFRALEEAILQGAVDFYAGGALGWDTLCAETVLALRERYPIRLHMILPCPKEEQTGRWTAAQRARYSRVLSAADEVEIVSEHYRPDCMRLRNARLVERADCCFCYLRETGGSGTGQTVAMAKRKGIRIRYF